MAWLLRNGILVGCQCMWSSTVLPLWVVSLIKYSSNVLSPLLWAVHVINYTSYVLSSLLWAVHVINYTSYVLLSLLWAVFLINYTSYGHTLVDMRPWMLNTFRIRHNIFKHSSHYWLSLEMVATGLLLTLINYHSRGIFALCPPPTPHPPEVARENN